MPFQEDSGLEDVPSLLRNGNVAITPWTAQQHFFLFKKNGVLISESVENTARAWRTMRDLNDETHHTDYKNLETR